MAAIDPLLDSDEETGDQDELEHSRVDYGVSMVLLVPMGAANYRSSAPARCDLEDPPPSNATTLGSNGLISLYTSISFCFVLLCKVVSVLSMSQYTRWPHALYFNVIYSVKPR